MCRTEMLKSFSKVLEIAGEWVVQGATVCTVWKKKKEKRGVEQEHNSLVSVARLLFSSFYLHFSTTEFTFPFFLIAQTEFICFLTLFPFNSSSSSLSCWLCLWMKGSVLPLQDRWQLWSGDYSTRWLLNQLFSNKTQTGRLFMGGGN